MTAEWWAEVDDQGRSWVEYTWCRDCRRRGSAGPVGTSLDYSQCPECDSQNLVLRFARARIVGGDIFVNSAAPLETDPEPPFEYHNPYADRTN